MPRVPRIIANASLRPGTPRADALLDLAHRRGKTCGIERDDVGVYSVEVAGHPTSAAVRAVNIVCHLVIASAEFVIIRVKLGRATASPAAAAAAIAWDGLALVQGLVSGR